MVDCRPLGLSGALEILPNKFGDDRGFFSETFNARTLSDKGINVEFVQDNHSLSATKGVLRGLHFQKEPYAQDKLVRVTRGRVFDVLVDIRHGSPTYKKWIGIELSAEKWNQLFIPKGFLHGFLTLEENTEFLYKVSSYYSPDHDFSIRYDDPELNIKWPSLDVEFQLSEKDNNGILLSDLDPDFKFGDY